MAHSFCNTFLIAIFFIILNFSFSSCHFNKEKEKGEVDEWQISIGAPYLYPAFAIGGDLWAGDKFASIPTDGYLTNPWGETGLTMGTGNFIPDSLSITWFSVVENKFYEGRFKLPHETMESIFNNKPLAIYGKKSSYDLMIVNVAPGGVIVLWMESSGVRKVEIGRYQATETEADWSDIMPTDRDTFLKESLGHRPNIVNNLKEKGLQIGLFDSYRIRYPWHPAFYDENVLAENQLIEFFNGELDNMWGETLKNNYFKQKALPRIIYFKWHNKDGKLYGCDVTFNEEEVFEAFKEIYKNDKDQETELVFVADKNYDSLIVTLRSKTEQYELRKTEAYIYPRRQ